MALLRKHRRSSEGEAESAIEQLEDRRQKRHIIWKTAEPVCLETSGAEVSPIEFTEREQDETYVSVSREWSRLAEGSRSSNPYASSRSLSFMARSRYFEDTVVINEDQARSYPIGDADGPSEDDLQLLRLQGAFKLPPRAVRDGLINTFMERCAPWMPIIERNWLEDSGSQKPSMLLLQAIFVAASRVTSAPAVISYASTHQFYRRAKALFWSGYEKNPLTVVAAVCILHWYNPEGPEHVSTNTSGFWRYVGVGLAHQIGLHKEPTNKREASLRRRLWWTLFARDCLISAGQGRPLAVGIDDCELAPPCLEDFHDSSANGSLFIAYVEISSILGHLTQCYRRKSFSRHMRQAIENRLYRWTRDLPASLRLYQSPASAEWETASQSIPSEYSFEARQLHIPYFICLAIMCRSNPGNSPSPAVVLSSSFVAGIFEDFLARDEIQFLGPIFTFHLLAAGIGLLSCNNVPTLWGKAQVSLQTIYLSLDVLAKRWSSAKGSLMALKSIADKQQITRSNATALLTLPREHQPFFADFGPDISWAWSYIMTSGSISSGKYPDISLPTGTLDVPLDGFPESQAHEAISSADEYRPLTTILDPHMGFNMGDMTQGFTDDFFHNQYQGMGDWLFKDLDCNGEFS
ncbi:hypothetical protein N7462_002332 [Penicillium macrosclerotiorum]|uniref:uncharacterized protein n=1 Tax=Penicillium macrosclerotiorum TaxID=303699 RepID=UPI00254907A0|nr:uncharacterized protein N7462_002332 [Penicillium macrosclerotiorum]KAJ5692909.1 hypothetical protein N7462_002332 [Penicillium macrosclerotiorum]